MISFIFFLFQRINDKVPTGENLNLKIFQVYCNLKFNGTITNKFVDEKDHNFKKVVITDKIAPKIIRLDYENPELFLFLQKGDSIVKKVNSLNFQVIRNNFDTIIRFDFQYLKREMLQDWDCESVGSIPN